MPGERRKFSRREKVFLIGHLQTLDGTPICECSVIDISVSGARIHIARNVEIPESFTLVIPRRSAKFRCAIVHRLPDGETMGVKFA